MSQDFTRLKFSEARGARIQYLSPYREDMDSPRWRDISNPRGDPLNTYRIHPEDAHLEYGPISSALRDDVLFEENRLDYSPYSEMAWKWINEYMMNFGELPDSDTVRFFALSVAEYFADMGI